MLDLYVSERVKQLTGGVQTPASAKPGALGEVDVEEWFDVVRRSAPFAALPRSAHEGREPTGRRFWHTKRWRRMGLMGAGSDFLSSVAGYDTP